MPGQTKPAPASVTEVAKLLNSPESYNLHVVQFAADRPPGLLVARIVVVPKRSGLTHVALTEWLSHDADGRGGSDCVHTVAAGYSRNLSTILTGATLRGYAIGPRWDGHGDLEQIAELLGLGLWGGSYHDALRL